jgi:hypothetical protein
MSPIGLLSENQTPAFGGKVSEAGSVVNRLVRPSRLTQGADKQFLLTYTAGSGTDRAMNEVSVRSTSLPTSPSTASARGEPVLKAGVPSPSVPERRRSARQYLALARPVLVKRLLTQLDGLAEHAQSPAGGVYVFKLNRLTNDALQQFFDDGFLALLLAVRNALTMNNSWMRYPAPKIRLLQQVVRKYAGKPSDNGRIFQEAILELNRLSIDTTPLELPDDLWLDEEE